MAKKINRVGERNINNQNVEMTIIKYNSTNDIDVTTCSAFCGSGKEELTMVSISNVYIVLSYFHLH